MNRRTLIASIGTVAAGGAAIGTGAFTSVEADRSVNVAIADEDTGLLALERLETDEGEFVIVDTVDRNEVRFDFNNVDDTVEQGKGLGTQSVYRFDRLFAVTNQGTQTTYVKSDFGDLSDEDLDDIGLYVEERDGLHLDGEDAVVKIEPGHSAALGFEIDSSNPDIGTDLTEQVGLSATIQAEDQPPEDEDVVVLDNTDEDGDDGGEIG